MYVLFPCCPLGQASGVLAHPSPPARGAYNFSLCENWSPSVFSPCRRILICYEPIMLNQGESMETKLQILNGEWKHELPINPQTGEPVPWLSGWVFYEGRSGRAHFLPNMKLVHTHEVRGRCVALTLAHCWRENGEVVSGEPLVFPPLPQGVPLTGNTWR